MTTRLILATRRSALALAQSRAFARAFIEATPGLQIDELEVVTKGDRITDRPLVDVGGKGLFIKELEEALKGDDKAAIEGKTEALMSASQKLGEKMYADTQAAAQAAGAAGAAPGGAQASAPADDNVVDAEVKEVKKG